MSQDQNSTDPNNRIAKPGDIFLLLVPMAHDLQHLKRKRDHYAELYGGHKVDFMHITMQRFTPINRGVVECTEAISHTLNQTRSFMVYTDGIIQFSAPYWGKQVLRWRIAETAELSQFRSIIKDTLQQLDCPTLFHRIRKSTCTMLTMKNPVELNLEHSTINPPQRLFHARNVIISQLQTNLGFKTLETISLRD